MGLTPEQRAIVDRLSCASDVDLEPILAPLLITAGQQAQGQRHLSPLRIIGPLSDPKAPLLYHADVCILGWFEMKPSFPCKEIKGGPRARA